jgi:hypothetical protein
MLTLHRKHTVNPSMILLFPSLMLLSKKDYAKIRADVPDSRAMERE